jgi:hypothetical protein
MSKQEEMDAAPEVVEAVTEKNIPYPLTAIDGDFRLAGAVDFWRISNIVDEILKQPAETK